MFKFIKKIIDSFSKEERKETKIKVKCPLCETRMNGSYFGEKFVLVCPNCVQEYEFF